MNWQAVAFQTTHAHGGRAMAATDTAHIDMDGDIRAQLEEAAASIEKTKRWAYGIPDYAVAIDWSSAPYYLSDDLKVIELAI